ncbi:hypothetical protein QCA50_011347 [Cerrena zonata]|uniref:Uncharacterized protein n=1 Tax=Cerrena zonata TaxID=2478898 RepID=A0AAW0FWR2_9APHY
MTEYDFSQEGFDRYMKTQERVQKWVYRQAHYAREYDSPFVPRAPSTLPPPSATVTRHHSQRDAGHAGSPSRHNSSSAFTSSRPTVHRSATLPPTHSAVVQKSSQPPSRHSRSQSHALPPQAVYQQQPYYQGASPVGYAPPSRQIHGKTTYQTYTFDSNAQIVLPPPKRGDTYIIVPPAGRKVEVVHEPPSRSSSRSIKKPANKPLLKRLLTLGSTSGGTNTTSPRTGRDRRGSY